MIGHPGDGTSRLWVWVDNGVRSGLVDPGTPALSAVDHGLTVGDGAFETAKTVDGVVFAASRHRARMDRTLSGLGLPPADHDLIGRGIDAVLDAAGDVPVGRLRYTVTGGSGPTGSDRTSPDDTRLSYVVTLAPVAPQPASVGICTVPWVRNERSAIAGLKTTSYAENVVALAAAKERGAVEAIMANTRDELCEGTATNVFVVRDGVVLTPPLESGCLAGITRGLVVEWCQEAGIPLREQTLPFTALEEADEVFVTSSIKDVMPVHDVDGRTLAAPGPVTQQVLDLFARNATERTDP